MKNKKKAFKYIILAMALFLIGFVVGYLGPGGLNFSIPIEQIIWLGRLVALLSVIGFSYFLARAYTTHKNYLATVDDDESYELYKTARKTLDYSTVMFNISQIAAVFNVIASNSFELKSRTASFLYLDLVSLVILFILVFIYYRVYGYVREVKVPFMISSDDLIVFMEKTADEAELQVEYRNSYKILHALTAEILPVLYIILGAISILLNTNQIGALLSIAAIHLYITISQLRITKEYFK
ncbi:DUF3169 family protein [Streptococcus merionis]|uniref:DUF3169 family protein n=1 Tax=Streptococcus merionis TaxID=400065 RepID=UPI003512C6B2